MSRPRRYGRRPDDAYEERFRELVATLAKSDPRREPEPRRLDADDEVPGRVLLARIELRREVRRG